MPTQAPNLDQASTRWLRRMVRGGGPIYLALAEAIEAAIRDGELQPGDQLPPQRTVAALLGVDFTTVTRAYGAARERGLLEGAVGRGTFVRARATEDDAGLVDLSMNLPPPPDGVSLAAMLRETTSTILGRTDAATLMAYHPGAGALGQKTAGAAWLAPCLGDVAAETVLVCAGAQAALAALLASFVGAGGTLIVEPLTYPGLIALAAQLGLKLIACPVDGEGPLPADLDRLCAEHAAAAVYLIPTTQNPTASTMGLARRREVAAVIARRGAWLIEDDPYSRLFDAPLPAVASFAPERAFYLATLSKTLSPGLRTAFLATPGGEVAERAAAALHTTSQMAAPLMTAVAASWIREGAADDLLAGVRREARARRKLAAEILPMARGAAQGVHVWIDLPESWRPQRLSLVAQQRGLSLVTAQAFQVETACALDGSAPNGVRISLGGPAKRSVLAQALTNVAGLLADLPTI